MYLIDLASQVVRHTQKACSILVVKSRMLSTHLVEQVTFCEISSDSSIINIQVFWDVYGVSCVKSFLFTQQRNISDNCDHKVSRLPGSV
jgi:hypothetical protein